jgi:two-component system chemotaxis response regulator CheY
MESPSNIMVVDENTANALFWEMTLKSRYDGCTILVCKTGIEALDLAKKQKIDFFVASWELKPMSGLIFMQKLREIRKFRHAPFLIFSQLLNEEDISLAQEFGITNYLLRPFDKTRVIEKVEQMFASEGNLDNIQKTLRKVEDWIVEGKINEALKLISDCLKPGNHAALAYTLNGDIWSRTEHADKAEKSYKEALGFDSNFSPAVNGLGKLYLKLKRFPEAIQLLESLHKRCPSNLSRMICLGNAYLGTGEDTKAEALFKQVRDLDKEVAEAPEGLGKVNFNRGNMELAAKFFKESGKGAELGGYFNSMGIAMVNQGNNQEAINLYRNAMQVLPDKDKFHLLEFNIGLAYKKSDLYAEAVEAFARSLLCNTAYDKAFQALQICIKEAQNRRLTYNQELVTKALQTRKSTDGSEVLAS